MKMKYGHFTYEGTVEEVEHLTRVLIEHSDTKVSHQDELKIGDYARLVGDSVLGDIEKYLRLQFKAGDEVRLINGGGEYPLIEFEDGEIYTVMSNNAKHENGKRLIRIINTNGKFGYARPDQIKKIKEES